jgi:hypothetical protein
MCKRKIEFDQVLKSGNLIFTVIILLYILGCTSKTEKDIIYPSPNIINQVDEINEPRYYCYSDSMVNNIFETIIEDQKIIKIDSTKDLHSFDLGKFQYDDCNNFDLELISALTEINNEVSKPQNLLLGVSDYLCNKTFCDKFKSFVFYAKSNESHYGNAIELITIDNNSNSFHKITLSQEYLNEGYEYTLESKFKTKSKVEITKKEFFNISDNIKDNDSISAKRKVYQIKSNGQIIEI